MLRNEFIGREILEAQRHGDFSFANILIDHNRFGMIGIIDWDNSKTGQPLLNDLVNLIESTYNSKDLELGYTVTNMLLKDKLTNDEKTVLRLCICFWIFLLPFCIGYIISIPS